MIKEFNNIEHRFRVDIFRTFKAVVISFEENFNILLKILV